MTIHEVSKLCDLSPDTLRYYERSGMVPPVTRTAAGVRDYQEEDLGWVQFVKCLRLAGFPVRAVVEYMRLYHEGEQTSPERLQLLREQRKALLEQRANIDAALERLDFKINFYENEEAVK